MIPDDFCYCDNCEDETIIIYKDINEYNACNLNKSYHLFCGCGGCENERKKCKYYYYDINRPQFHSFQRQINKDLSNFNDTSELVDILDEYFDKDLNIIILDYLNILNFTI